MPRPLLLVDFDGVWTDMRAQAAAVTRAAEETLATLGASSVAQAHEALERVRRLVRATPERFGWICGGRISAFADEDPSFQSLRLWLVRTPFTPPWALEVAADPTAGMGMLDRVAALGDLG